MKPLSHYVKKNIPPATPKSHNPNHIPRLDRLWYGLGALALFLYATIGLCIDDIYIPGRRRPGHHFHGVSAWLAYAALLCLIANWISVIVDHYDTRNNEIQYKWFARITYGLSLGFLLWAAIVDAH